jgi:hypothetical protein
MVLIFVIDCELFKRFQCSSHFYNSADYIKFCESSGFVPSEYIDECKSLIKILSDIRKSKCKLAHNSITTEECLKIMLTCPPDLKRYYNRIISSPNSIKHDYTLTIHEKGKFNDTVLINKVAYIDAARKNDNRIVITTRDFIEVMEPECYLYLAEFCVDYGPISDICKEES